MSFELDDRGQTLQDFAIGMAIFLLVVGYVFAFVPGLFEPYEPKTDSTAIRVDRTVDFLTEDLLAVNGSAGTLNRTCTEVFFGVNGTDPADCPRFSSVDGERVRELAALPETTTVNVTMVRNGSIATHPDASGDRFVLGEPPPASADRVIRAVRVVSFDGRDYQLVVKIW